jgi:SAM-dependent methyltransferase
MDYPKVLDVCCGGRMFWFDKSDHRAVFVDNRTETHWLKDSSVKTGQRKFQVIPNVQADFRNLPFASDYFRTVVFDPPHFDSTGPQSWLRAKYGTLEDDWRSMLRDGFSECFRVLVPGGTLIFKWNEYQIKVSEILKLTPVEPLFGHRSGRHSKTHWVTFAKPNHACTW